MRRQIPVVVFVLAALTLCSFSLTSAQDTLSAKSTAIVGVTIVDVRSGGLLRDRTVVITGNRVERVAPRTDAEVPAGAQLVDAHGRYLIPGLWDMHAHQVHRFPGLYIANGVTGVRHMGASDLPLPDLIALRKRIEDGHVIGPRLVIGVTIDGRKGHPAVIVATNAEQGGAAVNSIRQAGADFVKVYQNLSRDAYFAIANQARRHHMPFAGHLPHAISAHEAGKAGQRSIEHSIAPNFFCFSNEQELRDATDEVFGTDSGKDALITRAIKSFDQKRCAEGFRRLAADDVWRTPTLMTLPARMFDERWLEDPHRIYVGPALRRIWEEKRSRRLAEGSAPATKADSDRLFSRIMAEMQRAGVGILAGSDATGPEVLFAIAGFALHHELDLLVKAGLTPLNALRAATVNAARFFDKQDAMGTVEAGKLADLVLLDANPLEEIRHTQRVRAVVANGRYFDRAALDGLLDDAKARVAPR